MKYMSWNDQMSPKYAQNRPISNEFGCDSYVPCWFLVGGARAILFEISMWFIAKEAFITVATKKKKKNIGSIDRNQNKAICQNHQKLIIYQIFYGPAKNKPIQKLKRYKLNK